MPSEVSAACYPVLIRPPCYLTSFIPPQLADANLVLVVVRLDLRSATLGLDPLRESVLRLRHGLALSAFTSVRGVKVPLLSMYFCL